MIDGRYARAETGSCWVSVTIYSGRSHATAVSGASIPSAQDKSPFLTKPQKAQQADTLAPIIEYQQ